jgi:hypothetical protein
MVRSQPAVGPTSRAVATHPKSATRWWSGSARPGGGRSGRHSSTARQQRGSPDGARPRHSDRTERASNIEDTRRDAYASPAREPGALAGRGIRRPATWDRKANRVAIDIGSQGQRSLRRARVHGDLGSEVEKVTRRSQHAERGPLKYRHL